MGRCVAHDTFRCLRMDIGLLKQPHKKTTLNPIRFTVERERLTMPPKAAGTHHFDKQLSGQRSCLYALFCFYYT
jgi:hypothetical protein